MKGREENGGGNGGMAWRRQWRDGSSILLEKKKKPSIYEKREGRAADPSKEKIHLSENPSNQSSLENL